jgi:hypothetical protein
MPQAFMTDGTNGNDIGKGRIDALREKERQIRAAIAAETVKCRKREFKEFERLKNIIGGAVLASAAEDAAFAHNLRERLAKCAGVESEKNFLRAKGWL